ncbi:MAG: HD domain-containing protein [Candidatus Parcubacteria bacterium]|nr:HD domain-containing protein [Candidatus Parcubacteria bacterium]
MDKKKANIPKTNEDHKSFMQRFRLKITPSDMEKVDYAYDMAKYGHRNQFREGGDRYFEHVRATSIILIDELGITDVEVIISALLHDMLEDSFLLTPERIKITFGERTAIMVSAVTKPKKDDPRFVTNDERHAYYFNQVRSACMAVKLIKIADRLQNLRTLSVCSFEKQKRKVKETRDIYFPLLLDIAKEYPEKAEYLSTQMNIAIATLGEDPV